MTKADLVEAIAKDTGLSKADAARAVESFVVNVTKALNAGDKVTLVGFGSFSARQRAARKGVNPRTGDTINIPASKTVGFTPGKALKDSLNK